MKRCKSCYRPQTFVTEGLTVQTEDGEVWVCSWQCYRVYLMCEKFLEKTKKGGKNGKAKTKK